MIRENLILDIFDELIVDNFAGGGGASTGIFMALGRHVNHARNHSYEALGMHRINHPQTIHHCEDIWEGDPVVIVEGRPVGAAWFSPDCKHFSKAKGGKPLDKKIRGLALEMLRWAKIRSRVMFMENVEEIETWGPLLKDGRPDKKHKGRTWKALLAILGGGLAANHPDLRFILEVLDGYVTKAECVRGFGYHCETKILRACDYGAPTIRKRLFMIARCDGRPIVWPTPTHFNPKLPAKTRPAGATRAWRTIAECIDWERPCPSIFLNKAQAKVARCRRPLAASTLRRIATGIDRYVLKAKDPFLVQVRNAECGTRSAAGDPPVASGSGGFLASLTHQGGERIEPMDEPAKTITGAHRGEKALVAPVMTPRYDDIRPGHGPRSAPANQPINTITGEANVGVLTEAKLVAPTLTREFGQSIGQRADEPAPTVMPHGQGKTSLVETKLAPFLTEHANASNQRNVAVDKPAPTLCAETKGGHFAVVAGTMVQTGYGEAEGQKPRALDVEKPLGTIVSGGKHAVVAAHLTKFVTGSVGGEMTEPSPTITAGAHSPETHGGAASTLGIVKGTMVQTGHYTTHSAMVKGVDEPMRTQATAPSHAVATANLVKLRGGVETHDKPKAADEPIDAISAGGTHHAVVTGTLVHTAHGEMDKSGKKRGRGARDVTESMPSVLASPDGALAAAYLAQHNDGFNTNPGHDAREPISTVSAKGCQQTVVAGSLAAYYGNDEDGQAVNEPGRTVTTKERFGLVESTLEEKETPAVAHRMTEEQISGALRVAKFLRAHGVVFDGEFATVAGYVIVDIGMRMLTARELFRAQGFPEEYVIDKAVVVDPKTGDSVTVTLTKEQQIRMCGNSVCPPVAAAIIRSNVPELAVWSKSEVRAARANKGRRRSVAALAT